MYTCSDNCGLFVLQPLTDLRDMVHMLSNMLGASEVERELGRGEYLTFQKLPRHSMWDQVGLVL